MVQYICTGDYNFCSRGLASLIDYISSGKVTDKYTHQLDGEVNEIRNYTGKERAYMTYMQTIMEHEDMAYNKAHKETAINMLKDGFDAEKIIKYTKLTVEEVSELAASLHSVH